MNLALRKCPKCTQSSCSLEIRFDENVLTFFKKNHGPL